MWSRCAKFLVASTFAMAGFFVGVKASCILPYPAIVNGSTADANQVTANFSALSTCQNATPGGDANSVQYNSGGSGLAGIGPLTNGQIIIGSTGSVAQAKALTAGPGVSIANASGGVTISTTGSSVNYRREIGAYAPPNVSSFTYIDGPSGSIAPQISNIPRVGFTYSVPVSNTESVYSGAYRNPPSLPSWTLTIRAKIAMATGPDGFPSFGIWAQDGSGKMVGFVVYSFPGGDELEIMHVASHNGPVDSFGPRGITAVEKPNWLRLQYGSGSFTFLASWDDVNWLVVDTESTSAYLSGPVKYIGVGGNLTPSYFLHPSLAPSGTAGAVVTYWDIDDDPASTRPIQ